MLKTLSIQNLATIENIDLSLEPGFIVLTGETGSGKSIIIDGIRLILGEKGAKEMIRTGETRTIVEAEFQLHQNSPLFSTSGESEILIQRILAEKGSGKSYLNGVLVPVKILKEQGAGLADIYGQNDHVFLHKIENQLDYLDNFSGSKPLREEVSAQAQELRRLIREKKALVELEKERIQRMEFLNFQINEIEEAGLLKEEEKDIQQERLLLKNVEKIDSFISEALHLSYDAEHSILAQLSRLKEIIAELGKFHPLFSESKENLDQFSITINELSDTLNSFKDKQNTSPQKLDSLEKRLSLIESLKRKYGNNIEEILSHLELCKKDFDALEGSQAKREELDSMIADRIEKYYEKARKLRKKRIEGASRLEKNIIQEIGFLGMSKAEMKIDIRSIIKEDDLTASIRDTGIEEIEFLLSPNPGEELRPLRKIASGGELSRIMLALKAIGKDKEPEKTLIFDEVDSGIGGKIAGFVAQKLCLLAKNNQVLCITHLPQIASYAEHHYRIEKKIENQRTYTTIKKLSREERVKEIARLISGSRITAAALQNAREMLEQNSIGK